MLAFVTVVCLYCIVILLHTDLFSFQWLQACLNKFSVVIEEMETESILFRQYYCRLIPPLQGTPANIPINLILPETTVIGLHLRR